MVTCGIAMYCEMESLNLMNSRDKFTSLIFWIFWKVSTVTVTQIEITIPSSAKFLSFLLGIISVYIGKSLYNSNNNKKDMKRPEELTCCTSTM